MRKDSHTQPGKRTRREADGLTRRKFLAAAAGIGPTAFLAQAAPGAAVPSVVVPPAGGKLAIDGGAPVRATRLHKNFAGPNFYDDDERRELLEVLEGRAPFRDYGIGPGGKDPHKCIEFEKEFAAHQGAKYCLAVTSGTAALIVSVAALGVGPGDEVILPAWTWYACYNAIIDSGATPVFADVDESLMLDPADVERKITPHTKVIMPVHIGGEPADMDAIMAIARRHQVKVLEDGAQSMGATYKGRPVSTIGDCGIYSFQICKTISAGEGGAVVTNDPLIYERAVRFHDLGFMRDCFVKVLGRPPQMRMVAGWQFRMNEWTGAVMRAQLRKVDRIVAGYREKGSRVMEGIADLSGLQFRKSNDPDGALRDTVYFRTASMAERDRCLAALTAENIPAGWNLEGSVFLPAAPHIALKDSPEANWPSFATPNGMAIHYGEDCCPRTKEIRYRYVGIPMDPKYSDQDVADIIAAVRKVYPAVVKEGRPHDIS
jgi:8-amino-3,8-dideoxy-alpha-D-manno-octulosonate transaminase